MTRRGVLFAIDEPEPLGDARFDVRVRAIVDALEARGQTVCALDRSWEGLCRIPIDRSLPGWGRAGARRADSGRLRADSGDLGEGEAGHDRASFAPMRASWAEAAGRERAVVLAV